MLFLSLQTTSLEGNLSIEYNSPSLNASLLPILYHPDLKEVKADYCGGNRHGLKYQANKYSGKKVTLVPKKQADYVIMINTMSNDVNEKSSCYSLLPGKDIVAVKRLGVKLSVLRKLEPSSTFINIE